MLLTDQNFYIPFFDPGSVVGKISSASFYLGARFNRLLYDSLELRNQLGLFTQSDLGDSIRGITTKVVRTQTELVVLDVLKTFSFSFTPVDPAKAYEPWKGGDFYKTYLYSSSEKKLEDVAVFLYNYTFLIGPKKIAYRAVAGSIKARRSRKSIASL